uniref:Uncharacterized protein n=1 Tax=Labrus bergylta TaxID=56723 RepID=A0A3Q3FI81_9LABR
MNPSLRYDTQMAVKVEKHSQYVILTYFQGDINSMVDAHFTRALSKVYKSKAQAAKTKKIRKTIKLGKQKKKHGLQLKARGAPKLDGATRIQRVCRPCFGL